MTAEDLANAAWAAVLEHESAPDEVPEGWLTRRELARRLNTSEATLVRKLRAQVAAGKVLKRQFRINTGSRGPYPTTHYFIAA